MNTFRNRIQGLLVLSSNSCIINSPIFSANFTRHDIAKNTDIISFKLQPIN